jgi:hypothetical protein
MEGARIRNGYETRRNGTPWFIQCVLFGIHTLVRDTELKEM